MIKKCKYEKEKLLEIISDNFPEFKANDLRMMFQMFKVNHKIFALAERHFAQHHFSKGKFHVLFFLFIRKEDGDITLSQIADDSDVTRSTITGLIDGLEEMKLIERYSSQTDRRKTFVRINDKGIEFVKKLFPIHINNIIDLFSDFDSDEKQNYTKILTKLNTKLEKNDALQKASKEKK